MLPVHIGQRMRYDMRRLLATRSLSAAEVKIRYEAAMTAEEAAFDPNVESDGSPAAGVALVASVNAFVHFVTPLMVSQRGWTEIAGGDLIADFAHDVNLEQYRNPRFEIHGQWWQLKGVGRELTQAWECIAGGLPVSRTLLLELS